MLDIIYFHYYTTSYIQQIFTFYCMSGIVMNATSNLDEIMHHEWQLQLSLFSKDFWGLLVFVSEGLCVCLGAGKKELGKVEGSRNEVDVCQIFENRLL